MDFIIPNAKESLKAALDQNWHDVEKKYSDLFALDMKKSESELLALLTESHISGLLALMSPLTEHNDNINHFLVHSERNDLLEKIVRLSCLVDISFLRQANVEGNTVLHEAAISGNLKAVELLVEIHRELVETTNGNGETPLFRAAAFGKTKVVRSLASHIDPRQKNIHCKRDDGSSILFAAVQGKHFGTALEVLDLFTHIGQREEENTTSLQMLAKIPSALKSQEQMGIWKTFLYFFIPVGYGHDDDADNVKMTKRKLENTKSSLPREGPSARSDDNPESKDEDKKSCLDKVLLKSYVTYLSIWKLINQGCPLTRRIWKEKRDNIFAYKLARQLIQKSSTWEKSIVQLRTEKRGDEQEWETPLPAAIRMGNVEFVKLIIEEYPQALTQSNHSNQNILHLAAMYRQKEIFNLVKEKEVLTTRLARQIDKGGYTVLHCVADTEHYIGGTRSGPANQLKAELEWFKRVEKIMPAYYAMLHSNNKKTPFEIFKEKHKELHKEAQQWMKDTSQSCSAVAVLVATVVFAAAFTVPGGTNDVNGLPILIHSPFFLFFTVMDVIALSCSLTAVVIFLSILTSPFELDDFYASLPRKLTLGFALLFMSVATTMFAFASTIFLVIRLDDRRAWTTTLICSASFFPVSVLALTHFPLFVSFINAWMTLFKFIWNALPCHSAIARLKSSAIYKKVIDFLESLKNNCRNYFRRLTSEDKDMIIQELIIREA